MHLFTVFILSLFLTIALVPVFKRMAFRMNIVDFPDARKVHLAPMPKTGGISMAIGAFVPMMLWVARDNFVSSVLVGSIIIVVFGLIDDIRPMTAKQKILPQVAAALVVIFLGGVRITCLGDLLPDYCLLPDWVSFPFTLFVILGVTNAINLADGLDGLAGGISMLSFVLIAFLAYGCENQSISIMAVAMTGAIAGFLRYNTHPAVLFMGDAGSQLLGFLAVVLTIALTQDNTPYARVMALPLIGFPILDTLTVMAERVVKGRSPFKADKNHFHHRLLRLGFFHTEAVFTIYIVQACFIAMAVVFRFYSDWVHFLGFLSLSAVILFFFLVTGKTRWRLRRDTGLGRMKNRLKSLKERKIFIRLVFGGLRYGFPLILLAQTLVAAKVTQLLGLIALGMLICMGACYLFDLSSFKERVLRSCVYILAPLLLYTAEIDPGRWMTEQWIEINNLSFIVLVFFVILTLNLTRRRQGFKVTTMDILVFIIILVFPNLPSLHFQSVSAGIILAKVLVVLFGYDVLVGELRGEFKRLAVPLLMVLGSLGIRGFM